MKSWQEERREIRREEKRLRKKYKESLEMNPLKAQLAKVLPQHLMPNNVGDWQEVSWMFFDQASFDFGANPTWTPTTQQTQSISVSNESAFIVTEIYRKCYSYSASGDLAPLQVKIVNRSSGQQVTDNPIPLQSLGKQAKAFRLANPYLIMPNSFIDITISSWVTANTAATVGSGKIDIIFKGYKTRIQDADGILGLAFGSKK